MAKRKEKNFIDFCLDTRKDLDLLNAFLAAKDDKEIKKVFDDHFYTVSDEDCKKLMKAKDILPGSLEDRRKY